MKKRLLLLFISIMAINTVNAQDDNYYPPAREKSRIDPNRLRFGAFFAPNISWMKPTASRSNDRLYNVSSRGSRTGYAWGLLMDYYFTENYGLSTGFQFNTTGGRILATYNNNITPPAEAYVKFADFNYRLQYLEVPLHFKVISDEITSGLKIFGNIGLGLGINVSKKATYEVITSRPVINGSVDQRTTGDNEKLIGAFSIAPVLFQLNVGGGVEYPISDKISLYSGLFFNNGFTPDVTNPREIKQGYEGKFSDGGVRLNNFALRIGLFF
ncbi:MAG: PorT family protein [Sphingobacteriales bacterium]|nr:MAG: PorT family protein [Sphingobacteriales bacterium]